MIRVFVSFVAEPRCGSDFRTFLRPHVEHQHFGVLAVGEHELFFLTHPGAVSVAKRLTVDRNLSADDVDVGVLGSAPARLRPSRRR